MSATPTAVCVIHACACLIWAGCGDSATPAETFETEVIPILESRCASPVCHGVLPDAVERGEVLIDGAFMLDVNERGRIRDVSGARRAALAISNTVEGAGFSSLLRKPLPSVWGGVAHGGGDNFISTADPAYETLARWIESESAGGEDPIALGPLELQFAEEVQPLLVGRSCGLTNCHGPTSFVPFRLDAGIAARDGVVEFDAEMTRSNYEEVRRFLALDGDPAQSRVLRKSLPLERGGIRHRGGNRSFIVDEFDALESGLLAMAARERAALVAGPAEVAGMVFIRGPLAPRSPFESESFTAGSALMLQVPAGPDGTVTDLTTASLGDSVDIQDPSVSPDGESVVFAMRRSASDGRRLYLLNLADGAVTPLTEGAPQLPSGRVSADLMPTFGGDGFVYFVSNRADLMAERLDHLDLDIYRVPTEGGDVERITFTPSPEIDPAAFRVGALHDYLVFALRRAVDDRDKTVGFSFPFDRHVDYHIYFGLTPSDRLFRQFRELPDGRAVCLVGDPDDAWPFGQLGIVDRNIGPDLPAGEPFDSASLPGYLPALGRATAPDAGFVYVDPSPLPDGSILAARAPNGFDVNDEAADADLSIVRLVFDEGPLPCGAEDCAPRVVESEIWADESGVADHSPEPVFVRAPANTTGGASALDETEPPLFSMVDIVVNDAVMTFLPPAGPRPFRDDVRWVRFVEALPSAPGAVVPVPADETANADPHSTSATNGVHMPARVLGEVELQSDSSVFVEVPAEVPFRTQLLDENRMSVGHQHNRWLFVWRGQHFSQSTNRALYDERCGGCHGSATGSANDVLRPPDVTTRATLTLARFDNRNPRRPRDPIQLGGATRVEVDFVNEVRPILEASCVECHGSDEAAGGVDLGATPTEWYDVAYESLMARAPGSTQGQFIDQRGASARSSSLLELLLAEELDAPAAVGEHPDVGLADDDVLTLVRWIETGAHYRLPGR